MMARLYIKVNFSNIQITNFIERSISQPQNKLFMLEQDDHDFMMSYAF